MKLLWNPPKTPKQITTVIGWGAPYAEEVHNGRHTFTGAREKARPWVDVALARIDLIQTFKNEYKNNVIVAFQNTVSALCTEFDEVIDNYDFGYPSSTEKQTRRGVPTWGEITDSGALRDSLETETRIQ